MKKIFLITLCCLFFLLPAFTVTASTISEGIKQGNRLYQQKKYDEAIEKYKEARAESPDSDIVNFNLGTALYKKGDYQEAIDAFTKALNTEDKKIESNAIYNIANSKYRLGNLKADKDLQSAIGLYRESLDYYKRVIDLDENNKDAKYNHELVEKKLRVLLDKLKNQPPQKSKNQSQNKKSKGQSKGSEAKSADKKHQKKGQQEAGSMKGKNKTAQKQGMEKRQATAVQDKSREMSPEEARMLLEAYGQEEGRKNFKALRKGYYGEVLKDW